MLVLFMLFFISSSQTFVLISRVYLSIGVEGVVNFSSTIS